jgi:hypothetical protein
MSASSGSIIRARVIREILESELTYNLGLQRVLRLVCDPLRDHVSDRRLVFEHPEVPKLFEFLTTIENASSTLSAELGPSLAAGRSVLTALRSVPGLISLYFDYIKAYHTTMPLLTACRESNKQIDQFFRQREELLGSPLDTFLITPVQRPPRYRLLFQELLKHTPPDAEDFEVLELAVAEIKNEISRLDHAIAELDEATAMAEISSRLADFQVFVLQRRLLFQGDALKFSRKRTEGRYFILFSDLLVVAEPGPFASLRVNKLFQSGHYLINGVPDCPPFQWAVDIRQKTKSFRANMRSEADKQLLLCGFEEMRKIRKIERKTLEQQGFAPVWIPDDQAPNCMACSAKFSMLNRRHHCRSCGDCICKNCFRFKVAIPGLDVGPKTVCTRCYERISGRAVPVSDEVPDLPI